MNDKRRAVCWIAASYAAFVVYGSLMPFRWHSLSLAAAFDAYLSLSGEAPARLSYTDFLTNLALFMPLALVWTACQGRSTPRVAGGPQLSHAMVVLAGSALLSASIEFAQLFTLERTSSVYDLTANTLGAALGVLAWTAARRHVLRAIASALDRARSNPAVTVRLRRKVKLAAPVYAAALCAANHWFSQRWLTLDEAGRRLADLSLLPFYYYQEASTAVALVSALWQVLLYAPLGIGLHILSGTTTRPARLRLPTVAAIGAGTACAVESGRLFLVGQHPDLGNVVVAGLAATAAFVFWPIAFGWITGADTASTTRHAHSLESVAPAERDASKAAQPATRMLSIALYGVVGITLLRFPVLPGLLAIAYLLYAVALMRWPRAWLWVLPAALPVLDLAPLSGWFMFDEFDMAVLVTVATLLWRREASRERPIGGIAGAPWALFAISVLVSMLIGLLPLTPIDANTFANYFSHYNALRIAKGFVWSFWLIWLLRRAGHTRLDVVRNLSGGIIVGLIGATGLAIWERLVFPGLFNFSQDYRVGAFFSNMHTGGSDVEAYFVMTAPFVLAAGWTTKSSLARLGYALLFLASAYVLMVTYARGGWGGFVVGMTLEMLLFLRITSDRGTRRRLGWMAAAGVVALVLGGVVVTGRFAEQRLEESRADLDVRIAHWREAIRIMDPGWSTALFGMGLGRFPETYYFRNEDGDSPATFRYHSDTKSSFLTLGSGNTLYVEQFVDVQAQHAYQLSLDLRTMAKAANLNVLLCARTYFVAYDCQSATFATAADGANWAHRTAVIDSHALGAGSWLSRRPVKLSLEDATQGTTIDVRNVVLESADDGNLIRNGSFADGRDHWFFSSTFNHLPWHTKNFWVGVFFDQGWLGVMTLLFLLAHTLVGLTRAAWRGDPYAAAALASTIGFLCVGLFGSLFDAPRLTFLFFLILAGFTASARGRRRESAAATAAWPPVPGNTAVTASSRSGDEAADEPTPTYSRAASAPREVLSRLGIGIGMLALLIAGTTRLPGVHYEARALLNASHPIAAPVVFAIFVFWLAGLPALAARWLESIRVAGLLVPAALALHAVVGWAVVREAVLPAMIHKVAGSPVLGWSWHWETLLRFSALEAAIALLLTGGCIAASGVLHGWRSRPALIWVLWSACLLPVLHYGIVVLAATDNLTELMVGGGGTLSSTALAAWGLLAGFAGALIAAGKQARRPGLRLTVALVSIPIGYALLTFGLEANVQKYGASFSALQFLLSSDRQHYAVGWELAFRYALLHIGVLATIALAQHAFQEPSSRRPIATADVGATPRGR